MSKNTAADQLNELAYNNEQLYQELRLCNEKFLDLRVENTKLREQIIKKPDGQYMQLTRELCELVTQFMHAMRQLQKAVNRKQADVSEQKHEFELAKSNLQQLVQSVKDQIDD